MHVNSLGIDGLEDIRQIGTGGSSRVYRAQQAELDRVVAVKVLNPGHDHNVAKRFDRERKAMGRLSLHEGIVPVYSSGTTANDEPYLVMPYYANGSLQDQIDSGALAWEAAVGYIDVAAETIAEAHDEGVVHLDLKPANILLSNSGAPRIADFGIARLTTGNTASAKTTGGAAFTPAYSAPETFLDGETGPPSDVYGLGATLWALLVGHPPFLTPGDDSNLMAVIGRVVNNPVGDLRHFTPSPICDVIEQAMAKRPEDRHQTAREFSLALKQAARDAGQALPDVEDRRPGTMFFPTSDGQGGEDLRTTSATTPDTRVQTHLVDQDDLPLVGVASAAMVDDGAAPAAYATEAADPTTARPLLQNTAHQTSAPIGAGAAAPGAPIIDLDRFRFAPALLGVLAFLGVVGIALFALNRGDGDTTAAVNQETSVTVTVPAAPALVEETDPLQAADGATATTIQDGDAAVDPGETTTDDATATTEAVTTTTEAATETTEDEETTSTEEEEVTTTTEAEATTTTEEEVTPTTEEEVTTTTEAETTTTTTAVETPEPPTGLSSTVDGTTVSLSWSAPGDGPAPTTYRIYRNGVVVGQSTGAATTFADTNVPVGSHQYTVRSIADSRSSADSSPTTATVDAPPAPTISGRVVAVEPTRATIEITSDVCFVSYRISAIVGAEVVPPKIGNTATCVTTVQDTIAGLTPGSTYQVNITVASEDGAPGATSIAAVTTPAG